MITIAQTQDLKEDRNAVQDVKYDEQMEGAGAIQPPNVQDNEHQDVSITFCLRLSLIEEIHI